MHRAVINPQVAWTLVAALCGFAGSLVQPLNDVDREPETRKAPTLDRRCQRDTSKSQDMGQGPGPLLVRFSAASAAAASDSRDAVALRCHIVNRNGAAQ